MLGEGVEDGGEGCRATSRGRGRWENGDENGQRERWGGLGNDEEGCRAVMHVRGRWGGVRARWREGNIAVGRGILPWGGAYCREGGYMAMGRGILQFGGVYCN